MPYDHPEPDDPNMLVGVELPGRRSDIELMAASIADEFAAMGYEESRLLALFHNPYYAGAHRALQVLGEEALRTVIRESIEFWRNYRVSVLDAPSVNDTLLQIEEEPCRK